MNNLYNMINLASYEELCAITAYSEITDVEMYVVSCFYYNIRNNILKVCIDSLVTISPLPDTILSSTFSMFIDLFAKRNNINHLNRISYPLLNEHLFVDVFTDGFTLPYDYFLFNNSYTSAYASFELFMQDYFRPKMSITTSRVLKRLPYTYKKKVITAPLLSSNPVLLAHNPFFVDFNTDSFNSVVVSRYYYYLGYSYVHNKKMFEYLINNKELSVITNHNILLYEHADPSMYLLDSIQSIYSNEYLSLFAVCTKMVQSVLTDIELSSFVSSSSIEINQILLTFMTSRPISVEYYYMFRASISSLFIYAPFSPNNILTMGDLSTLYLTSFYEELKCYDLEFTYIQLNDVDDELLDFLYYTRLNLVDFSDNKYYNSLQV